MALEPRRPGRASHGAPNRYWLFGNPGDLGRFTDNVHVDDAGQQVLADHLYPALKAAIAAGVQPAAVSAARCRQVNAGAR